MMKLVLMMILLNLVLLMLKKYENLFLSIFLFVYLFMMMFFFNLNDYWMMMYSNLGFDKISLMLMILTVWIFGLVILSSLNNYLNKLYLLILLLLMLILLVCFGWMNLFMFYFFFEFSLIPTFLLIMGWGYQPERIKASLYMLFYTLVFSLPLLFFLFYLMNMDNSLSFILLKEIFLLNKFWSLIMFFLMFMAFLVKLPMFLLHNWLPKAHVEAPLSGSMILAAIMLKLGGYGMFRMLEFININFINYLNYLMVISLFGMFVLSMLCLRHLDMKIIVAYSSVVHMGVMLIGLFSLKLWGYYGGFMMMLSHGLCSSGMFMMVNNFYMRSNSRNLMINKGMIYFLPSMMLLWFFLCMNNMASPPSLNLLSEIMIIVVILNWSKMILLILLFGMFLSACYNLYLFSYSIHGMYNFKLMKVYSGKMMEYMLLIIHLIPLNLLILKVNFLI